MNVNICKQTLTAANAASEKIIICLGNERNQETKKETKSSKTKRPVPGTSTGLNRKIQE